MSPSSLRLLPQRKRAVLAALLLAPAICSAASETADSARKEAGLQPYSPQPVPFPTGARYVLPDGSLYVAGNDLMRPLLEKLNEIFERTHPGFRFTLQLPGPGAMPGVSSGKSAFGPSGRDFTPQETASFASRYGYAPTYVQIGWDNTPDPEIFPPAKSSPGVWVNAKNPTPYLTLADLGAILTTGSPKGDISRWGQISYAEGPVGKFGGDWAKRTIHIYIEGTPHAPVFATLRLRLGGKPWSPRAEFLPSEDDVLAAVANDPFGIGLRGWYPYDWGSDRLVELGSKVRVLPLAADSESAICRGGVGDLSPLAGGLCLLVNRAPGKPLDPWLREYLALALSKTGQDLIASMTPTDGFIALRPAEARRELAKTQ